MKHLFLFTFLICFSGSIHAQEATTEAEFDTLFNFQFEALKSDHQKKVLIDEGHNTIYSLSYGRQTAREMLRIINADGLNVSFTKDRLDSTAFAKNDADLLIIHGIPNDKIYLDYGEKEEILYKSPL
jgi:hypothetical protein